MTTVTSFQYTYHVHANISKIYAHLTEPINYIGLSPLLISLTDVQWGTNLDNQRLAHYKSVERFYFLGFIRYDNPLDVVMTLTVPDQQIVSDVHTGQNVRVIFTFDLQADDGGTAITETVTTHTPALLTRFVIHQARQVQQNRARVLKNRMETGSDD